MNFNLSKTNGTAVTRLRPWTISKVSLENVELKTGTSSEGRDWKAMQFNFKGPDGIFEYNVFCPGEKGDERVVGTTDGREWQMPSAMEQLQFTIAHICTALAPEEYKKLQGIELDLPKDFEKLVNAVKKVLAKAIGTETNIKLIGNSKGYADVPKFININRTSKDAFISNNWLGENLAFTPYEVQQMNKAKSSTPTPVSEDDSVDDSADDDDIDLGL
jgi:hypothetical protein